MSGQCVLTATALGLECQAREALELAEPHVNEASPAWLKGLVGAVGAALVASEIIGATDLDGAWQEQGWRLG